jgi:hypothetical protein
MGIFFINALTFSIIDSVALSNIIARLLTPLCPPQLAPFAPRVRSLLLQSFGHDLD